MNALSKNQVALAIGSAAAGNIHSPFLGLHTRDTAAAKEFEQLCADLKTRKQQLDDLQAD